MLSWSYRIRDLSFECSSHSVKAREIAVALAEEMAAALVVEMDIVRRTELQLLVASEQEGVLEAIAASSVEKMAIGQVHVLRMVA